MTHFERKRYHKKLRTLLSRAEDRAFLQLIWAIDALQSGRQDRVTSILSFPAAAATTDVVSPYKIHSWELETLAGELFVTQKERPTKGMVLTADCSRFETASTATNYLRGLENAEAGFYMKDVGLKEMHRIAHRQFPWQRGYLNPTQFYRNIFIFGGDQCLKHFEEKNGIRICDFVFVGFALYSVFVKSFAILSNISSKELGITEDMVTAALKLLSTPVEAAKVEAISIHKSTRLRNDSFMPVAYSPSVLRIFPLLNLGNSTQELICPLPQLLLLRITSGIYYDLIDGGSHLRNEASDRFEEYCWAFIQRMLPKFTVSRSFKYDVGKQKFDTPDIFVHDSDKCVVIIECKATKLTFDAQFANNPLELASRAYNEIAKGIFQLWRFKSHIRKNLINRPKIEAETMTVLLILDNWATMAKELQDELLKDASILAEKDEDIIDTDKCDVVFCSIEDLEATLSKTDEGGFLDSMVKTTQDKFRGWALSNVVTETGAALNEQKSYPFNLKDVLPWWSSTR